MAIFLIRHGSAGVRDTDPNNSDIDRPLDELGFEQADLIADLLADEGAKRVLSSPAMRCRQTLAPLATRIGVEVEDAAALLEGQDISSAVALIRALADSGESVAICSHSAIIPDTIEALAREGMVIVGPRIWAKGSTWKLTTRGRDIVSAAVFDPI